jgi:hypothetical protein
MKIRDEKKCCWCRKDQAQDEDLVELKSNDPRTPQERGAHEGGQ